MEKGEGAQRSDAVGARQVWRRSETSGGLILRMVKNMRAAPLDLMAFILRRTM
jgi:hypothetical protein